MKHGRSLRRSLLYFLILLFPIHLRPAWGSEPKTFVVVSYPERPPKLPLWLANEEGLFEKHGLKIILKEPTSSEALLKAIRNGEGDIYAATATHIISGIGDGADLVFVANTGYAVFKLLSRPDVARPEDLKGKRVGTGEAGSNQDRITRLALRGVGLDPDKDVTLVPFGSGSINRLNALVAGQIDATTSNADNIYDLERRGDTGKVRVLADHEQLKVFIGSGSDFVVARNRLVNDRESVKAFIKALCEAIALAKRDRAGADRIYSRHRGGKDPMQLEFMYRTYVQQTIPQRPFPRPQAIALGLEEFGAKAGLKGKKIEELIDTSLIQELEREGLFERLYGSKK